MNFDLLHPRDQLVAIMKRIYQGGMTTLSGGNLSVKDDDGAIWITPAGVDKGTLTSGDMMRVGEDGRIVGPHNPSSEYPFHRAIYDRRPDFRAIVHAHPPALVAFSIARQIPDTALIPRVRQICGPVGYAPYALTGSEQLGANIADTFAAGHDVVLLENHGIVTGGGSLLNAFHRLETLDFFARTLMQAKGIGDLTPLTPEQAALFTQEEAPLPEFAPLHPGSRERALRQQLVAIVHRAYERQLLTGCQGAASARVDGSSFLITPAGKDRSHLTSEDLVLVRDDGRETGKQPHRAVRLHRAIYAQHAGVGAIMLASPPGAAAFAISSASFDTRTIPESYILLRRVPRLPFARRYEKPEGAATAVSPQTPVLLLENDGLLVVGRDILHTFDRLEVAEYSARSLIHTTTIGPLVPIGDADIAELAQAFPVQEA